MKIHPFTFYLLPFILFTPSAQSQDYWQQQVNYTISVKLDDTHHELFGEETMEYINNSPDELNVIYMHLWPNAYKDRSTALAKQKLGNGSTLLYYAKPEDRGYIDSLNFMVNGEKVRWEYDKNHNDICKVILNQPVKSGEKITLSTPFHVKIPKGVFSRLGHIGESYQITQWYPKPAVYDKDGWHPIPYLDQGEFYSEFGSYDVSITLPENYVVGATGDLVDGEKELEWLNKKVRQTEERFKGKDSASADAKARDKKKGKRISFSRSDPEEIDSISFPPSTAETKTLRFRQSNVHDFAWFADKRWNVLKGQVELPHSKRTVTTWVMFTDDEAHLWKDAIEYMNDAIYYYSLWNGDYPYRHATAVDGALSAGGGMEYPNITVIGRAGGKFGLETVIMHEVGHNWFYGILGSNERDHPWMDEGLNSFNENRYIETKYPDRKMLGDMADKKIVRIFDLQNLKHKDQYYLLYLLNARRNSDQPVEGTSADYIPMNYGADVYGKTAIIFDYLMAYLGEEVMDKAMRGYYDQWKFRHPQPVDFRAILEKETGKNLSWFFDNLVNSTNKVDYKIAAVKNKNGQANLLIKNKGDAAVPFNVAGIKEGKIVSEIWVEGFSGSEVMGFLPGEYDEFKIDPRQDIPEVNRRNNTFKTKGMFKKIEPLKLQFLGSLENPDKTQLFFTPVAGWNYYDNGMVGLALYNSLLPFKKMNFVIMPMYGFGSKNLIGSAGLDYTWYPKGNMLQNVRLSVGGARYSGGQSIFSDYTWRTPVQYNKIKPELSFELKKPFARSKVTNRLTLTHYRLFFNYDNSEFVYLKINGNVFVKKFPQDDYYINALSWNHKNARILNPYSLNIGMEQADYFVKASLEGKYRISYKWQNKGLDIRLFAARFLFNDFPKVNPRYGFAMDGNSDYRFDEVFLGRMETSGVLSRQFAPNDGGFKNEVSISNSQTWLSALNLQTPVLPNWPIAVYVDMGWSSGNPNQMELGTGAALVIMKNIFEVYFPFYTSSGMPYLQYEKNIRFVLNMAYLNPFELLKKMPN